MKRFVSPLTIATIATKSYATGDKRESSKFDTLNAFSFDFSIPFEFLFGMYWIWFMVYGPYWIIIILYQLKKGNDTNKRIKSRGCESDKPHIWSIRIGRFCCQSLWTMDHKYPYAQIDIDIYRISFFEPNQTTSFRIHLCVCGFIYIFDRSLLK